jgi:hypothetical protein
VKPVPAADFCLAEAIHLAIALISCAAKSFQPATFQVASLLANDFESLIDLRLTSHGALDPSADDIASQNLQSHPGVPGRLPLVIVQAARRLEWGLMGPAESAALMLAAGWKGDKWDAGLEAGMA